MGLEKYSFSKFDAEMSEFSAIQCKKETNRMFLLVNIQNLKAPKSHKPVRRASVISLAFEKIARERKKTYTK